MRPNTTESRLLQQKKHSDAIQAFFQNQLMLHGEHSGELLAGQTQTPFPGTMADTSMGENDIVTKDEGYGIDATQEFERGEDSDETPPPAEELGYQFKATDGVSSGTLSAPRNSTNVKCSSTPKGLTTPA
jgi:hypothetical protein